MRNFWIATLLLVVVTVGCENQAETAFLNGMEYYNNGHSDSALFCFEEAFKMDSSLLKAKLYGARCNIDLENYDVALIQYAILEEKEYMLDSVLWEIAYIYDLQDKEESSIEYYDRLIERNSSNYQYYVDKATSLYNLGNSKQDGYYYYEEALKNIRLAKRLYQADPEITAIHAAILFGLDDFVGAKTKFEEAIADTTASSYVRANSFRFLGSINQHEDNFEEAIRCFNHAISEDSSEISFYDRGNLYKELGIIELACKDFRRAFELGFTEAYEEISELCQN